MTSYKLTYFNGRGRAEIIRLVFAAAGQEYEDIRIERDQWPKHKPNSPFGQMPYFEFGDVKLCQSFTIARYVARKFGLAGKTEIDQAKADMIIDCFDDTVKPMFSFFFEKDEARKGERSKKFLEEQLPASLTALENLLKANKGGDGFFVGDALTWADLGLIMVNDWLSVIKANEQISKYPKLKALLEKLQKTPNVSAWLAKRPTTDF